MLEIKSLAHNFGGRKITFPDFDLQDGERMLILGNSGVGKSTLVHLVSGLLTSNDGDISIDNQKLSELSNTELNKLRNQKIGLALQHSKFIETLSFKEHMLLRLKSANEKWNHFHDTLVSRLGLSEKLNEHPINWSGGEQKRASFALACCNQCKLLICDEPTAGLDDSNCNSILELLLQINEEFNTALMIVTHDQRIQHKFNKVIKL